MTGVHNLTFDNLKREIYPEVNPKGNYIQKIQRYWSETLKYVSIWCHSDDRRLERQAKIFNECMDQLEQFPVEFPITESNKKAYNEYIGVGQTILSRMQSCRLQTALDARIHLQFRLLSLGYRCEFIPLGQVDQTQFTTICKIATVWKQGTLHFKAQPELTSAERKLLSSLCRYKEFAALVIKEPTIQEIAFNWVLRNRAAPAPLIQFAATAQKITESNMAYRLALGGHLRIKGATEQERKASQGISEKDLQIRCKASNKKGFAWKSILNPKALLRLPGPYEITVEALFKQFREQSFRFLDLDFFADGLESFSQEGWGKTSKVGGLEKFNRFPPVAWIPLEKAKERFKEINLTKEARRRFAEAHLKEEEAQKEMELEKWLPSIFYIDVLRGDAEYTTPVSNHVSAHIALPFKKDGKEGYHIYPFTVSPKRFPTEWFHYLSASVECYRDAVVGYPDISIFKTDAQHGGKAFLITHPNPLDFIAKFRKNHSLCYQLIVWNCATFALELLEALTGEKEKFFETTFKREKLPGILNPIKNFICNLPLPVQDRIFWTLFSVAGHGIGVTTASMRIETEGNIIEGDVSLFKGAPKKGGERRGPPWRDVFHMPSRVPVDFFDLQDDVGMIPAARPLKHYKLEPKPHNKPDPKPHNKPDRLFEIRKSKSVPNEYSHTFKDLKGDSRILEHSGGL